jgi:hypothetical protein
MKTPEGKIKKQIVDWLRSQGAYVFAPVQQGFGASTLDLIVCWHGDFVAIEVKTRPQANQAAGHDSGADSVPKRPHCLSPAWKACAIIWKSSSHMTELFHDTARDPLAYKTRDAIQAQYIVAHLLEARAVNGQPRGAAQHPAQRSSPATSACRCWRPWSIRLADRHRPRLCAHQRLMANFMVSHPRSFNLSDPAPGRLSTLWAADFTCSSDEACGEECRALIVSPLSVMEDAWDLKSQEICWSKSLQHCYGSASKRLNALNVAPTFTLLITMEWHRRQYHGAHQAGWTVRANIFINGIMLGLTKREITTIARHVATELHAWCSATNSTYGYLRERLLQMALLTPTARQGSSMEQKASP